MSGLTRIGSSPLIRDAIAPKVEYREFTPHRRPEEFVGIAGPHGGLALEHYVLEAIAQSRVDGRPHPYLVRGEWTRSDGTRWLDVGVDRAWLTANGNYTLVEGFLRWQCPGCSRLSGNHAKGCDYR